VTAVVRRVGSQLRPPRLLVVDGPGVAVDAGARELLRRRWQDGYAIPVEAVAAATPADAASQLAAAAASGAALVVNPGSADLVEAVPDAALSAYVEFAYPGDQRARFDRGPLEDIAGRGLDGYRWAIGYLLACADWPLAICRYGEERDQVGELRLPLGPGPHPLVVLLHGGGWKALWRKDIMAPMAVALTRGGYATWSIEFRRLGCGGGWPALFEDVAAAIDAVAALAEDVPLALDDVTLVGHSAGGQLALWAAASGRVAVAPRAVVSLAGLVDLAESAHREMIGGDGVVVSLLGGRPDQVPERYASTSPRELLPLGVPQVLVQGLADHLVDLVDQNRAYLAAARTAGDEVRLVEIAGAAHLDLIDPSSAAWPQVAAAIEAARSARRPPG
jgi:acetyl esterase/lipase